MWLLIVLFTTFLFIPLLISNLRAFSDNATRFLIVAIFGRLVLGAVSDFTASAIVGPLSFLAIYSLVIIFFSPIFLSKQTRINSFTLVLAIPLFFMFLSSAFNTQWRGLIETASTHVFFLFIFLLMLQSFEKHGVEKIAKALFHISAFTLLLVLFDMTQGPTYVGNAPGGYFAGYSHNSVTGYAVLFPLLAFSLARYRSSILTLLFTLVAIFFLWQVNYRTIILAAAPIAFVLLYFSTISSWSGGGKLIAGTIVLICTLIWLLIAPSAILDQFTDIALLLTDLEVIFKRPEELYYEELSLLTGRVFLWSQGIDMWQNGFIMQKLIGFGASGYGIEFGIHAHSGYVTFLFDYGIVGISYVIILFTSLIGASLSLSDRERAVRICGGLIGFAIINLATSPLLAIEGSMIFALLVAALATSWREEITTRKVAEKTVRKIGDRWQRGVE